MILDPRRLILEVNAVYPTSHGGSCCPSLELSLGNKLIFSLGLFALLGFHFYRYIPISTENSLFVLIYAE